MASYYNSAALAKGLYGYTGLQFDKRASTCFGTFEGYQCYLKLQAASNTAVFTVPAVPNDYEPTNDNSGWQTTLTNDLTQLCRDDKRISSCIYTGKTVAATLLCGGKTTAEDIAGLMRTILSVLRRNSLTSCCAECGKTTGIDQMLINDIPVSICSLCQNGVEATLNEHQRNCEDKPENVLFGIMGALIGAGALFLAVYLAWLAGFIAYITGALGMVVAMALYKKFAGKFSIRGGVICLVLCLCSAVFVSFFCVANTTAKYFRDEYESGDFTEDYRDKCEQVLQQIADSNAMSDNELMEMLDAEDAATARERLSTVKEMAQEDLENCDFVRDHRETMVCLKDISAISDWSESSEGSLWKAIIENLLWGVISVLVSAVAIPTMAAQSSGKYKIRPLQGNNT